MRQLKWILALLLTLHSIFPVYGAAQPVNPDAQATASDTGRPNEMAVKSAIMNWRRGEFYLQSLRAVPGMQKLPDGLQYRVLKQGTGSAPRKQDIVKCHFKGRLMDGTVFEQSEAGKPARIRIEPLIPGLQEALMLMSAGSRWEIYLPPGLAFGGAGKPPKVAPGSMVIYDIELIEVIAQEAGSNGAGQK